MLILAGDIGGTNTRLCLAETDKHNNILPIKEEIYKSGNAGLAPLIQEFIGTELKPKKACFAVAGFVADNKCKITNLPWAELDANQLQIELNIPKVTLINDFVAIAYNIVLENNRSLETLQIGEYNKNAAIAIIGAGTGLGKAYAIPQGDNYQVLPSEGGHSNFASYAYDEESLELLEYLGKNGTVDIEQLVSGLGIVNIFRFLSDKYNYEDAKDFLSQPYPSLAIAKGAKQGNSLCQKSLEMFAEAYGAAAGDMALTFLPFGGFYIAGGIAAKNIDLMKKGGFMKQFKNKARVAALLEKVPVHIVLNELEGLKGAVKYAAIKM